MTSARVPNWSPTASGASNSMQVPPSGGKLTRADALALGEVSAVGVVPCRSHAAATRDETTKRPIASLRGCRGGYCSPSPIASRELLRKARPAAK